MRVAELMTRDVVTVRPKDRLDHAVRSMQERNCGSVVVVDEGASVVGLLTDRDVCMAALRAGRRLSRLTVEAAMSTVVFTCRPEDSVAQAEMEMGRRHVRRLPVVDENGRLQGILSLDDVAREAHCEEDLFRRAVSAGEVGRTLGRIGHPRRVGHRDA